MECCSCKYIEENYEFLIDYAKEKGGGNEEVAHAAYFELYKDERESNKYCKKAKIWEILNLLKDKVKNEERKLRRRAKREVPYSEDWMVAPLTSEEKEIITKEYMDDVRRLLLKFLKKKYPDAGFKYYFYIELWFYKLFSGAKWEEIRKEFKVDVEEVQARRSEIWNEFREVYRIRRNKFLREIWS